MNFKQFLEQAHAPEFYRPSSVLCFRGSQDFYPLLFFSQYFKHMVQHNNLSVTTLDIDALEWPVIQSTLETSFLGMSSVYWLKSVGDLDEKKKKQVLSYIVNYKGPHCILIFIPAENILPKNKCVEIMLDPLIDKAGCIALQSFFNKTSSSIKNIVNYIYKHANSILLDTACLLLDYAQVLSASIADTFIADWLSKIITPEKSLFTLSTYFFAKKPKLFFQEWVKVSHDYTEQFWIVYWSEQLWRAYHFVELSKRNQLAQAKKIAVRLPFTFMQRDWHNFTLDHLKSAHHQLYEIDYALKNGGQPLALEVFYSNFFTK